MNDVTLHLRPDELAAVREILHRLVPGREVWAFGSRAGGTPRPSSDLDLVVLGDTPLSVAVCGDLREAFTESALPFRVDVVDWAETGGPFREVIRRRHAVIQRVGEEVKTVLECGNSFAALASPRSGGNRSRREG